MCYPRANGQSESTNKTVIKKQLKKAKGLWDDKLPSVLWAYQTTACTSTGKTPFSLAFDTKAILPVKCDISFARYMWLDEDTN